MNKLDSISLIFLFLISLIASIGFTRNAYLTISPVYIILASVAIYSTIKSFYILWNRATK